MEYTIMISRIEELCQKRGINKTTAFVQSGVGKDFSSNLKKGNVPSSDKISLLADYLNCSTDYLLGRTAAPEQPMQFQTTKEQQLIAAYKAHPELQPAIDKLLGITEHGATAPVRPNLIKKDIAAFGGAETLTVDSDALDAAIEKALKAKGLI